MRLEFNPRPLIWGLLAPMTVGLIFGAHLIFGLIGDHLGESAGLYLLAMVAFWPGFIVGGGVLIWAWVRSIFDVSRGGDDSAGTSV